MSATPPDPALRAPAQEAMAGVDCAWLRMDSPQNLMVIHGVHMFEEPVEREALLRILRDRLAQVPRFRCRVVERRGRLLWEEQPGFDPASHLLEATLPPGSGDAELRALVGGRMDVPLPLDRPLWEVTLVHGYGSGSALLWRLHHCLGDGIALMVLMLALTDLKPSASGAGPYAWGSDNPLADLFADGRLSPREALAHLEEMMPEGARLLVRPAEEMARTPWWVRALGWLPTFLKLALRWPDPRTRFKGAPLTGSKRVAWSRPIDLAEVRRAREPVGGTVNDVLLTAITGALRRYLAARGDRTERLALRAVVPVSLRPVERMHELGNQFGLVFLSLPVGTQEPRRRFGLLRRNMLALRRSLEPLVALHVLAIIGRLPLLVQRLVVRIFGSKGSTVLTSVPGPNRELYLAGRPVSGMVFWVPQSAPLGMGISILTYAGNVRLGVMTDSGLVGDPEAIVAAFEDEIATLSGIADGPAATASRS